MKQKINYRRIFYTILVIFLCITDQRRGSADGRIQFIFVNLTGVGICLFMMSAYRWKSFLKPIYGLWTLAFLVGAAIITYLRWDVIEYRGRWFTGACNILFLGYVFIKTLKHYYLEKESFILSKIFFAGFLVTFSLFCISKNDSFWPLWLLALFGLLYATDFSDKARNTFLLSLQDGLIISFFLIQGLCFVFRPYDTIRYNGLYANPNMNALFYSMVYCGLLGKYARAKRQRKPGKMQTVIPICYLALAGSMWSFVALTMCRTAIISMGLTTLFAGIYCLRWIGEKYIKRAAAMVGGLLFFILLSFPIVFSAVRYLPPLFHHPIWFVNEYSEEKVHSWDPYDSPKYIDFMECIQGIAGRVVSVKEEDEKLADAYIGYKPILIASTSPTAILTPEMLEEDKPVTAAVNIRSTIYKHYLGQLNLTGHLNAENGVQVTEDYAAPHAHNMFLQMAFSFGIPAGLLFALGVFATLFMAMKNSLQFHKGKGVGVDALLEAQRQEENFVVGLFMINSISFGMLEIMWLTGQLPFMLLFLFPIFVWRKKRVAS